jgi:hypothetical protein
MFDSLENESPLPVAESWRRVERFTLTVRQKSAGRWPGRKLLGGSWVPLDKREGVVKQHFSRALLEASRGCQSG